MRPDGSERRTVTPAGMVMYPNLAWTATDAALLAIGAPRMSDPPQVFSVAASDGRVEQITNDVRRYYTLSFSPATGTIATMTFTSLGGIWVGPVDRPEAATAVPGRLSDMDGARGLAWLDNERLLLTRDGLMLWTMHADGANATRLSDRSPAYELSADRDGSQVVFLSVADGEKLPDVFRMTLADRRVTRVTREPLGVLRATLSPDGRTVLYTPAGIRPATLMSVAAEGGAATSIFEAADIFAFAASPDGTQVAVVANSGVGTPRTVSLVPLAGGSARTILSSPVALLEVQWYPKGDALLVSSTSPQPNLYRLDVASGQLRQLTKATGGMNLGYPVISPDGRRIAYFRGTEEPDIVLLKP
jgi:Tol biopolymer transport system component